MNQLLSRLPLKLDVPANKFTVTGLAFESEFVPVPEPELPSDKLEPLAELEPLFCEQAASNNKTIAIIKNEAIRFLVFI
ncbi:hypothetical protein D3C78_1058970 [compost metagenome]